MMIENNDFIEGYGRKNIQAQFQIQHKKTYQEIGLTLV